MRSFGGSSAKGFKHIPSLSIGLQFECTNRPWEPKMLIGRLCHASIDLVSMMEAKTEFDHWRLKLRFRRIMKIAVDKLLKTQASDISP